MVAVDLVSGKEACRILDCDKSTLGRWVRSGKLVPAYRGDGPNGIMLFNRADIDALT